MHRTTFWIVAAFLNACGGSTSKPASEPKSATPASSPSEPRDGGAAAVDSNLDPAALAAAYTKAADACDAGDAKACAEKKRVQDLMVEATKDDDAAEYREVAKKCEGGDGEACADQGARLGLATGGAPRKDPAKALELELKSCDLKYGLGCQNAGQTLIESAKPDEQARGWKLLERACAENQWPTAYSCTLLGMHLFETGNAADKKRGKALVEKACKLKESAACERLKELKSAR